MGTPVTIKELLGQEQKLLSDAESILLDPEAGAEEGVKAQKMVEDAMEIKERISNLEQIEAARLSLAEQQEKLSNGRVDESKELGNQAPGTFKAMGEFYQSVFQSTFRGKSDPRLSTFNDPGEPANPVKANQDGWIETKDLVENIGASGGFLVPVEQDNNLYKVDPADQVVRPRATIVPMRRRQIQFPVLDQTGTTASQPHWFGGVLAKWTEEAGSKEETQPSFRQMALTAYKLVCYTEASDELLADSAISLEALLQSLFAGTINWQEENAFIKGSGAGQPLGVINAGATITVNRQATVSIGIQDIVNMLESFQGTNPVWLCTRQALSNLMLLNGPAGNPSYIFMPSARDGMPNTLFGYPLIYSEHCPALGTAGDLILADWSKYLIGDRQAVTVDASKHYKFQNDLTAWRAVHRVDGRPWLSAPLTYEDGTTQVSPFVILGDKST